MWLMAQLVLYVARIFSRHIPFQKSYRLHVAVEAEAGKGLDAGHAGVGQLPEALGDSMSDMCTSTAGSATALSASSIAMLVCV